MTTTILTFSLLLLLPIHKVGRMMMIKKYREKYELSLLSGDENRAMHLGLMYYHMLSEGTKKRKGIVNIVERISEEIRDHHSL